MISQAPRGRAHRSARHLCTGAGTGNGHWRRHRAKARWRFERALSRLAAQPRAHCRATSCAAPPAVTDELQRRRATWLRLLCGAGFEAPASSS